MLLEVVGRTGPIFEGEVSSVTVPSVNGSMTILAGHQPLLAVLTPGKVAYTEARGSSTVVETKRGFATVDDDHILVVVDGLAGTPDEGEL